MSYVRIQPITTSIMHALRLTETSHHGVGILVGLAPAPRGLVNPAQP